MSLALTEATSIDYNLEEVHVDELSLQHENSFPGRPMVRSMANGISSFDRIHFAHFDGQYSNDSFLSRCRGPRVAPRRPQAHIEYLPEVCQTSKRSNGQHLFGLGFRNVGPSHHNTK